MLELIRERWGLVLILIGFTVIASFLLTTGSFPFRRSWLSIFVDGLIVVGFIQNYVRTLHRNRR